MLISNATICLLSESRDAARELIKSSENPMHKLFEVVATFISNADREKTVFEADLTLEVVDLLDRTLNTDNDSEACMNYFLFMGILAQDVLEDDDNLTKSRDYLNQWLSRPPVRFYWRTQKGSREIELPLNEAFVNFTVKIQHHVKALLTSHSTGSWKEMVANLLWAHALHGLLRFCIQVKPDRRFKPTQEFLLTFKQAITHPLTTGIMGILLHDSSENIPYLAVVGIPEYEGTGEEEDA